MQRIAERMPVRAGRIVSKFMTFTLCASSLMACGGGAVPNELQAQVTTIEPRLFPSRYGHHYAWRRMFLVR